MAKRVFFSFHYQDVIDFRANVVRNHWLTKPDRQAAGFFDASVWENAKRESDLALKRLINGAIQNTSVTCVLIGTGTWERRWVRYEIMKSFAKGNKLIGVHLNAIRDKNSQVKSLGINPFEYLGFYTNDEGGVLLQEVRNGKWGELVDLDPRTLDWPMPRDFWGKGYRLSDFYPTKCWIADDGYNNFSNWMES